MKKKAAGILTLFSLVLVTCVIAVWSKGKARTETSASSRPGATVPAPRTTLPGQAKAASVAGAGPASTPTTPSARPPGPVAVESFADWLHRFEAAAAKDPATPTSPDLVDEGVRLALERRPAMLRLMKENPWEALNRSVKWHQWATLPAQVQAQVEEPFSETADLSVIPYCWPAEGHQGQEHQYRVSMRGQSFETFIYGRRQATTSKQGLPLQGIVFTNQVALWENPGMVVENEDLAAVNQRFPGGTASDRSWWSGQPLEKEASTVLLGGSVRRLASQQEVTELNDALAWAEGLLGPYTVRDAVAAADGTGNGGAFDVKAFKEAAVKSKSLWTENPKKVLCLRLDYTPTNGTPFSASGLLSSMQTCSNSIREMSFGKTWIIPTVTPQVFILPNSQSAYNNGTGGDLNAQARAAAAAAGYNLTNYDIFLYSFPTLPSGAPAWTDGIGGINQSVNGVQVPGVSVHEFGHSFGLDHALFWQDYTGSGFLGHHRPTGEPNEFHSYGDLFDMMGFRAGDLRLHFSMRGKSLLNWIEPAEVLQVTNSGRYRIYRFDDEKARVPGTHLALKIYNADAEELWVGFRRNIPEVPSIATGAYILWADGQQLYHYALDATPLSQPNAFFSDDKLDSGLPPCRSWTDPSGTVRITNLGWGGAAPYEYLDLEVEQISRQQAFDLFTDSSRTLRGLVGSYVNQDLRGDTRQDWRSVPNLVAGTRLDPDVRFTTSGWGARAPLHLTGGTDNDWEYFSAQWDGVIVVHRPITVGTWSDDGSRMWIDLNGDGIFSADGPEFVNNNWGSGQGPTIGNASTRISPGVYAIRIQYEEGSAGNVFRLIASDVQFEVFTDQTLATNGMVGSYVGQSLRNRSVQDDWRSVYSGVTISSNRVDFYPGFFGMNSLGLLASVGLNDGTHGTDADWDNFSVQWDGYLRVYQPMRFATVSQDGSWMWIDLDGDGNYGPNAAEFVNNHWGNAQGPTTGDVSPVVNPGTYKLQLHYEAGSGGNNFILYGAPAEATTPDTIGAGLFGEYFNNADFTGSRVARIDPVINFDWGIGPPHPAIGADTFSVRWSGYVLPAYAETYTFCTASDDGVRLWVNNQLLIDNWTLHGATTNCGAISLQAGQLYSIRMEMFENTDQAVAKLYWSSAHTPLGVVPQSRLYPEPQECVPPPANMVAWWTGDADARDIAGANFGAEVSGAISEPGYVGQAFSFNGTFGWVDVNGSVNLNGARTIEAWVYPRTHTGLGMPIVTAGSPGAGVFLGVAGTTGGCNIPPNGLFLDNWGSACLDSGLRLAPDAWNHVAMTFDGTTVRFYLNGVAGAAFAQALFPHDFATLEIGANHIGGTVAQTIFHGLIDDISFYSRALADWEIQSIFAAGRMGKCQPPAPSQTPPPGLLAWWPGNDNAFDAVGNSHGTLNNGVTFGAGKVGSAFSFDGVDDFVAVNGTIHVSGPRTIEAWVYPRAHTGLGLPIVAAGSAGAADMFSVAGTSGNCNVGQYELYIDHWGTACLDSNQPLTPNAWNHVAFTYDGSTVRFYCNGVAGAVLSRTLYDYDINTFVIGGNRIGGPSSNTSQPSFDGLIDEVSLYSRALSAAELGVIYTVGSTGKTLPPRFRLITQAPWCTNCLMICWPRLDGYLVQWAPTVPSLYWQTVTNEPVPADGENLLLLPLPRDANGFFRLYRP